MGTFNEETGEITSTNILVDRTEIFDDKGIIKTEVLPPNMGGSNITVSVTPPDTPQTGDIWIQIE